MVPHRRPPTSPPRPVTTRTITSPTDQGGERIIRRGYGFHSAKAVLALVMLAAGPITLTLPREQPAT